MASFSEGVSDPREGVRPAAEGALSSAGLRAGIEGGIAECNGVRWGEGDDAGVPKPDNESLGFELPPPSFEGRGLSAREGNEFEGTCQPP